MWKPLIPIALFVLLVWATKHSSGIDRGDLIGRWSAADRPFHLEFLADGSCSLATIGPPRACTFELDHGTLIMAVGRGPRIRAHAEMRGARLELYSDGEYFLFDRVP